MVHGGIDGFSRFIVYLGCNTNNTSDTVLRLFVSAPKCRDIVLGSYVRGMSLVARAHNVQLKLTRPSPHDN